MRVIEVEGTVRCPSSFVAEVIIHKLLLIVCTTMVLAANAHAGAPPEFVLKWGVCGSAAGETSHGNDLATDAAGNVYVADIENTRVDVFDGNGSFVFAWGSLGTADGQFTAPIGIALDQQGHVFVVDELNANVQKFESNGTFITKWGSAGSGDGQFEGFASRVAVDASGSVYVTEISGGPSDTHLIQKFDNDGNFITKWGTFGTGPGQFDRPFGIAVDPAGHVYVADWQNNRVQKFDGAGNYLSEWGTAGTGDGEFMSPLGVAVGPDGSVYVTDQSNHRIQKFDASGAYLTQWGSEGFDDGQFEFPLAVAVDPSNHIFIADGMSCRIQKFAYGVTPTIRKTWGSLKALYR